MATFKVLDREFELRQPRGRVGRRATNYLLQKVSGDSKGEAGVEQIVQLVEDDTFLDKHLPAFMGSEEDAKYVDENANTGELLSLIMLIVSEVFDAFQTEEVSFALKNSQEAQGEE